MEVEENTRCRSIGVFLFGRTGLFLLVIGYAFLGALVFKTLEGGNVENVPVHIQRSREDCLKELWLITERLNVLYEKNWTYRVTEQLKRFEEIVIETGKNSNISMTSDPNWTFGGALLYTLTLLTTIGHGRLSPRTAAGKIIAMFYAVIGVPLMLVLLSLLGSLLADITRKCYSRLCCKTKATTNPAVGYHKAPTSPTRRNSFKNSHDDCTIQILPHNSQNSIYKPAHILQHADYRTDQETPNKTLLATVRASHSRGRCRQDQVRQMLTDPHFCSSHSHGTPTRNIPGSTTSSDLEETEDAEDSEHGICIHSTPSRMPLIYRPTTSRVSEDPLHSFNLPPVPVLLVLIVFSTYVCVGAILFTERGWSFFDAAYFCFVALSTIGLTEVLPNTNDLATQLQLFAYCVYLFVGLVVVAMCFNLVQEEIGKRCKQFARNAGFDKAHMSYR